MEATRVEAKVCRVAAGNIVVINAISRLASVGLMNLADQSAEFSINGERLLERFLRYVRVDTTADPDAEGYPSSEGQRRLGTVLLEELRSMGIDDARQDEHGLVYASLPASSTELMSAQAIALIAHMDTSPEACGKNVRPRVIENYGGGVIELSEGGEINPPSVEPRDDWNGKTLVTTAGDTLLGGDDKCGVAIIMELAQTLIERPELPHGPIEIVMTCDEEIGHGTDKIDLDQMNAVAAYTIDGGARGMIDVETFSADAMSVTFRGRNIHPAIAKNEMINALRLASDFVAALPRDHTTPETTDQRDGFIHPHTIRGGVGETSIELILRSFDESELDRLAEIVTTAADSVIESTGVGSVEIIRRRQYRNLADGLADFPEVVAYAEAAFEKLGRPCTREIVRGGTDGSQLTEKGLPTPNLSSGQYNIHSTQEFACLDDMVEATEHLVVLAGIWAERSIA